MFRDMLNSIRLVVLNHRHITYQKKVIMEKGIWGSSYTKVEIF